MTRRFGILIENYFTTVIGSPLRDLTWEEGNPPLDKGDRIPIKKNIRILICWRTKDIGNFQLYFTNTMARLPSVKRIEWRDWKIQIDNLSRVFDGKTEFSATENVLSPYTIVQSNNKRFKLYKVGSYWLRSLLTYSEWVNSRLITKMSNM